MIPEDDPSWRLGPGDVATQDCEVVEGSGTVDQSAITGESAAVIREALPGYQVVLAGSRILTGALRVRRLPSPSLPTSRPPSRVARWWPAAALAAAAALELASPDLPGALARLALLPLLPPYLLLLSTTAASGIQDAFWRRHRTVPARPDACQLAANCDSLVLPDAAVWENGRMSAVEFWPLPGVAVRELAAAARQASLRAEGGPGRSIVVLAKRTGVRGGTQVRAPHCGPVEEVAAEVARQGGLWPQEAAEREGTILARGGSCLGVADGGRPLGLVELRPAASPVTLDDVARAGVALIDVANPDRIQDEVGRLAAQGRRVALVLEPEMGPLRLPGGFTLGGLGVADRHPTALDLDANPGKLPALLVGARRAWRRCRSLRLAAALADGLRALGAVLLVAGVGRGPQLLVWLSLPAVALALGAGGLPARRP